ncbi:MAG: insulinase family protein [Cyanobacteria bacterium SZAS-4]|nr:insulinase family protein [Cyanobacteria bacterium SZAS-4]
MDLSTKAAHSVMSLLVALSTVQTAALAEPLTGAANATTNVTKSSHTTPDTGKLEVPSASVSADQWRKNPPTAPAPRPFKLPTITSYKLDNGLQVQLIEDHRVPFLTVALGIKAGSALESRDKLGLAEMTADMLNEGTTSKKSKEIADETDFIGGGLKAVSDFDFTIVSGSALSKYSDRLVNLLSDIVFHPTFPEEELKLAKTNLTQALAMKRSEPDFLVEERFHKVLFGDHPYGIVAPTPATIDKIARTDLQEFHDKHYLPNESTLVIVGDFDPAHLKQEIETKFGSSIWKSGTMPVVTLPSLPKQSGRKIYLVDRPGSVQSSIKIGNVGISKSDPDYFPTAVANQILGGAAHSRLFLNIREQKGYTYGAYSSVSAHRQPGPFAAEAEVRTEVTAPSLEEFLYELSRIRDVKVTDKELKDAKTYIVGSFQLGLETQAGLAQRLLELKLYDLPDNYLETYSDKVMAVTPDQIRKVARKVIDTNNIVISVVGDASKIKQDLQYFAPVEVYDTTGKLSSDATSNPASL